MAFQGPWLPGSSKLFNETVDERVYNDNAIDSMYTSLDGRIGGVEQLGKYLGSFDYFTEPDDTPPVSPPWRRTLDDKTVSSFTGTRVPPITPAENDFVAVVNDNNPAWLADPDEPYEPGVNDVDPEHVDKWGKQNRYVIPKGGINGENITWDYDITYDTDIVGKMDLIDDAVGGKIVVSRPDGNVEETGLTAADLIDLGITGRCLSSLPAVGEVAPSIPANLVELLPGSNRQLGVGSLLIESRNYPDRAFLGKVAVVLTVSKGVDGVPTAYSAMTIAVRGPSMSEFQTATDRLGVSIPIDPLRIIAPSPVPDWFPGLNPNLYATVTCEYPFAATPSHQLPKIGTLAYVHGNEGIVGRIESITPKHDYEAPVVPVDAPVHTVVLSGGAFFMKRVLGEYAFDPTNTDVWHSMPWFTPGSNQGPSLIDGLMITYILVIRTIVNAGGDRWVVEPLDVGP